MGMSEWTTYQLGEITEWYSGGTPSKQKEEYWNGEIPWISARSLKGTRVSDSDLKITQEGLDNGSRLALRYDLLLLVRGSGLFNSIPISIVEKPVAFNQDIKAIRIKKEFDYISPWFLLYWFYGNTRILNGIMEETGIGAGKFDLPLLKDLTIEIPPQKELEELTKTFKSIDDKLILLQEQNQTLEELAQTLFKRWFVENEDPEWELKSLSEIADIKIGRTPPRKEEQWFSKDDEDVKWVSIKDLGESGIYILNTSEYLTQEAVDKFKIPLIRENTVLLSFKMTLGRVGITTETMVSNEAIAQFIPKKKEITPEFLYFYLKTFKYQKLGSTSSIVTSINSGMIKDMPISVPDTDSLSRFSNAVKSIFEKIKSNSKEIQSLTQLRDTLLPKLMSGELKVKELV
ncbi:MAG: restriction endonuclease subunit S [Flavobacteriales bacterium]|nr:restriction endonuclease subunit S [Flavobacteriales bacterium]